jgi:hypothetical protein
MTEEKPLIRIIHAHPRLAWFNPTTLTYKWDGKRYRVQDERTFYLIIAQLMREDTPAPEAPKKEEEPAPAPEAPSPEDPPVSTKMDEAMLVALQHPDWTNKQVAEAVDCHEKYLTSREAHFYKELRKMQREQRRKSLPRGTKSGDDGGMEAWDE